jgi:hypothetical protein
MRWQALWRRPRYAEQRRQGDKTRTIGNLITVIHTRTLAHLSGGCPKEDFLVFFFRLFSHLRGGFPKEDEDSIKMHRTSLQRVFSAKLRRILREREQIFSNSEENHLQI